MMATFFSFVKYEYPLTSPEEVAAYEARKLQVQAKIDPLKARIAELEAPHKVAAFEKLLKDFPEEIQVAVHTPRSRANTRAEATGRAGDELEGPCRRR